MVKSCFFCGQKLNLVNSVKSLVSNVKLGGNQLCNDCMELYESMTSAESKEALLLAKSSLLNRVGNNRTAKNIISNHYYDLAEKFGTSEEDRQQLLAEKNAEEKKRQQEAEKRQKEFEDIKRRELEDIDSFLKENGHEGYYEYRVLSLRDSSSGCIDLDLIYTQLNELGRQGWHLRCAFTNEIGKESSATGIGGFSTGTNASIDQNILILERFIKFK